MNFDLLLNGLPEVLQVDGKITPQFRLADGNWDSVAVLSTIALIDESYGITVSGDALRTCATVEDVERLILSSQP